MEYAQWELLEGVYDIAIKGLNPCFNGICSMSLECGEIVQIQGCCLNPCFNGICSMSEGVPSSLKASHVLILVLMEYAQWEV